MTAPARTLRMNGVTSEAPPVTGLALQVKTRASATAPSEAVDGVSLDINEGEIFGLLGPNGAGKTSTLSAIEGLLKPTSGSILIRQVDARAHPGLAKALIGVQLQSTSFQSELKISEIVKLYAGLYGCRSQSRRSSTPDRNPTWATKRPGASASCQAGSRRACRCSYDSPRTSARPVHEPTSGLDPQARRQLWDRIEGIRKSGRSILLTCIRWRRRPVGVRHTSRSCILGKILTVDTPTGLIEKHKDDPNVLAVARGQVTLEDVFIGLTGRELRE